jgi:hypothetical protein
VVERRGPLAVLLVVAVMVVALAARSDHRGGAALRPSESAIGTGKAMIVILVALGMLVVAVLTVWGLKPDGPVRLQDRPYPWKQLAMAFGLLLLMTLAIGKLRPDDQVPPRPRPTAPATAAGVGDQDRRAPSSAPVQWGFGAVGVALLLGAAAAVAFLRRPGPLPERPPFVPPVATPEERDDAVATAIACTDPREAVLLAFAAAEAVLSRDPSTRRPPATSAREWASAIQSPPLTTIVGRYEIARFSQHAVSDADRRMALDALRDLQVPV